MKTTTLVRLSVAIVLVCVLLAFSATPAQAWRYVNYNKGYAMEIPDHWRQLGSVFVNAALSKQKIQDPSMYDYDLFLSPDSTMEMFGIAFGVVSVELDSVIAEEEIRELMVGMTKHFDNNVKLYSDSGAVWQSLSKKPTYDSKARVITEVSVLSVAGRSMVQHLTLRFYSKGIATIRFMVKESFYDQRQAEILAMIASFTEEIETETAPTESIKIVDVGAGQSGEGVETERPRWLNYVIFGALPLFAILAAIALMKGRKSRS